MAKSHTPSRTTLSHSSRCRPAEGRRTVRLAFQEQHSMGFHMKSVAFHLSDRMSSIQNRWAWHYFNSQAKYFKAWCLYVWFRLCVSTKQHLSIAGRLWRRTLRLADLFVRIFLLFAFSDHAEQLPLFCHLHYEINPGVCFHGLQQLGDIRMPYFF